MADLAIVTSDNPRSEDPMAIIDEILVGVTDGDRDRVEVEPDRAAAIRLGISLAEPGDMVIIAGKGHETHADASATRCCRSTTARSPAIVCWPSGRAGARQ